MSLGRRKYAARKGTEKAPGTGRLRYLGVSRGNLESFKSCCGPLWRASVWQATHPGSFFSSIHA